MLRTSDYTIFVTLPEDDAAMLLVHGYTGAHDRVPRPVAEFLRAQSGRPAKPLYGDWQQEAPATAAPEAAALSSATLSHLAAQGYLTDLSPDEEQTFFAGFAAKLHEHALRQPPSYILMPTYDCNLRCAYCYQDHMRTDGTFRHLLRTMSQPVIDRIFAAMPQIEERHGLEPAAWRRRNIGLFGGEPLLAANRSVVAAILAKAFAIGDADLWAVTNGTELDAYRDLLGPHGIARLQITLDGPPDDHDARRIHADGSGSFARIAANITMALDLGAEVSVRMNVDRGNLAQVPALAGEIMARGWDRHPGFSAYTSPIRAGNGRIAGDSTLSSWELDRALTDLRAEHPDLRVVARPDEGMRARARRLFSTGGEVLPSLRPSFCGAHDRMYIFDPFADIYACWEKTGDAKVRVGRVTESGGIELHDDPLGLWRHRTVASNPVCRRCRYALHCGGGCAVLALAQNGRFDSNYCDGFAARFRASLAEAYGASVHGSAEPLAAARVCDL